MNAGGMPKTCKSNARAHEGEWKLEVLAPKIEVNWNGISLEWQTGE